MQTIKTESLKLYARVARTFPKAILSGTNARIGALIQKKPK